MDIHYLTAKDKKAKSKIVDKKGREKSKSADKKSRVSLKERIQRKVESMGISQSKKDSGSLLFEVTASIESVSDVYGIIEKITDEEVVISTRHKMTHGAERVLLSDVYEIAGGVGKASCLKVKATTILSKHIGSVSVDGNLVTVKTEDKLTVTLNKDTCKIKIVEYKQKKSK